MCVCVCVRARARVYNHPQGRGKIQEGRRRKGSIEAVSQSHPSRPLPTPLQYSALTRKLITQRADSRNQSKAPVLGRKENYSYSYGSRNPGTQRLRNLSKITQLGGSGVMLERQVPGGWLPGMDSINRLWRNAWTSLKASVLIQRGLWKKLKQKALGVLLIRPIPLSPQAAHFLPHFWILHPIIWSTQDHALGGNLREIHT